MQVVFAWIGDKQLWPNLVNDLQLENDYSGFVNDAGLYV